MGNDHEHRWQDLTDAGPSPALADLLAKRKANQRVVKCECGKVMIASMHPKTGAIDDLRDPKLMSG
jgi:hypothetical protein